MSVRQAPRHDGAAQHLTLPAFGKQSSIGAAFGRPHHLCRDRAPRLGANRGWFMHVWLRLDKLSPNYRKLMAK